MPKKIFVYDDDSTDDTESVCGRHYHSGLVQYTKLRKPDGVTWRDSASFINKGIRACLAICKTDDIIICTHPEVMPGVDSIEAMSYGEHNTYVNCKPYYLTPRDQESLDSTGWQECGAPVAVRRIPNFYAGSPAVCGGVDYTPKTIENTPNWESWVFGGMTALTWKKIGGMSEHNAWGSIDVTFFARRHILGIPCATAQGMSTYCVHQNHDTGTNPTPRSMEECMNDAHKFKSPIEAIYNHLSTTSA